MRKEELFSIIGEVDEQKVAAAGMAITAKKKSIPAWIKWGAVAACLCAALLLSYLGVPTPTNTFFVNAYAIEIADDGTVELKEMDLLEQSDIWAGHFDGENFYLNFGFRYDGSNIKSVDFITEDGFFAKQYIDSLAVGEHISKLYVGPENKLVVCGTEFEIVGNRITLNDETMTDNLLLFWGTRVAEESEVPEHIEIKATATFYNGRAQEVTIPIDLSSRMSMSSGIKVSEEEFQQSEERRNYYTSLPLEQCELLEESVETVTDVYEAKLGWSTSWLRDFDKMEFDENGIHRSGYRGEFTADGYEVYIPVIKRDENDVYTGMIYHVPKNLQYTAE